MAIEGLRQGGTMITTETITEKDKIIFIIKVQPDKDGYVHLGQNTICSMEEMKKALSNIDPKTFFIGIRKEDSIIPPFPERTYLQDFHAQCGTGRVWRQMDMHNFPKQVYSCEVCGPLTDITGIEMIAKKKGEPEGK